MMHMVQLLLLVLLTAYAFSASSPTSVKDENQQKIASFGSLIMCVSVSAGFWFIFARLRSITLMKMLAITIISFFVATIFHNHQYLNEKKELIRRLKLAEPIYQECFSKKYQHSQEWRTLPFDIFKNLRYSLGYRPLARRCVDYQEALNLPIYKNNYGDAFFLTLKQFSGALGEAINAFYHNFTKNMSYFEFWPLVMAITTFVIALFSMICLFSFNYEIIFSRILTIRKKESQEKKVEPENKISIKSEQPAEEIQADAKTQQVHQQEQSHPKEQTPAKAVVRKGRAKSQTTTSLRRSPRSLSKGQY